VTLKRRHESHVLQWLDKLLTENDVAFVKWDYIRNWSEHGWPAVPKNEQKNVYVDFSRNF
jgi:alpha-galactosidase